MSLLKMTLLLALLTTVAAKITLTYYDCTSADCPDSSCTKTSSSEVDTGSSNKDWQSPCQSANSCNKGKDKWVKTTCYDPNAPCFARDTLAVLENGQAVPMSSLRSGDLIMDGPGSTTRVIVNQHREASIVSSMRKIEHTGGELELTPDHVLEVDGAFVAARNVVPGSKLDGAEAVRVTATEAGIINPLTVSGKILTQGGVVASTYPEWIAEYMLTSSLYPLPFSLSNGLSYLFPETVQAYYDAFLESFFTAHHPSRVPACLVPLAFLLGDVAVCAGFVGYSLASLEAVVALSAVVAAAALAKKARK